MYVRTTGYTYVPALSIYGEEEPFCLTNVKYKFNDGQNLWYSFYIKYITRGIEKIGSQRIRLITKYIFI